MDLEMPRVLANPLLSESRGRHSTIVKIAGLGMIVRLSTSLVGVQFTHNIMFESASGKFATNYEHGMQTSSLASFRLAVIYILRITHTYSTSAQCNAERRPRSGGGGHVRQLRAIDIYEHLAPRCSEQIWQIAIGMPRVLSRAVDRLAKRMAIRVSHALRLFMLDCVIFSIHSPICIIHSVCVCVWSLCTWFQVWFASRFSASRSTPRRLNTCRWSAGARTQYHPGLLFSANVFNVFVLCIFWLLYTWHFVSKWQKTLPLGIASSYCIGELKRHDLFAWV